LPDMHIDEEDVSRTRPHWATVLRNVVLGFVAFLLVGNGLIMASVLWFRATASDQDLAAIEIDNFRQVDDRLFRGAAPDEQDYADLASIGVTTVVDLRAESNDERENARASAAGLVRVHLPIRDGQIPSAEQVAEFLDLADVAPGAVFLHCGAGVGRTGAMSAAFLNMTGQTEGTRALRENLAVGPPSLEQIAFSLRTSAGGYERPSAGVVAISRVLDGPRRIWHNLT
jgi:protein tyrosine phosphatase (PTP) superfamily phosphohydrolase (DUF442 family)